MGSVHACCQALGSDIEDFASISSWLHSSRKVSMPPFLFSLNCGPLGLRLHLHCTFTHLANICMSDALLCRCSMFINNHMTWLHGPLAHLKYSCSHVWCLPSIKTWFHVTALSLVDAELLLSYWCCLQPGRIMKQSFGVSWTAEHAHISKTVGELTLTGYTFPLWLSVQASTCRPLASWYQGPVR